MSKRSRTKSFFLFLLCCGPITPGLTSILVAQSARTAPEARVLITQPIDPGRLHTLEGNTRGEANPQNDRGKVPDSLAMDHMLLQLQRSSEREQALKNFIDQQHDSTSPNFHKWLTAAEFGQMYGPAPQDIETVSGWLRSNGFTVNTVYPSGMSIDFSGTAGQVSAAFHTEIHRLSVGGEDHIANMSDPQIPEALAPVVAGVVSLHDFRPHSMRRPRAQYTAAAGGYHVSARCASRSGHDLRFEGGFCGRDTPDKGQTIAVLEDSDLYNATDWTTFRSEFGLNSYTSGTFTTIHPAPTSGTSNCSDPGVTSDDTEATLDAEWASAAAPNATIELASCSDTTTFGVLIAAQNLINGSSSPSDHQRELWRMRSPERSDRECSLQLACATGGDGRRVAVCCGGRRRGGKLRFGAWRRRPMASASVPMPLRLTTSPLGEPISPTLLWGRLATYWSASNSSSYGSAISYIPEIPWNDSCAGSILSGYSGYSIALWHHRLLWQQCGATIRKHCSCRGQRRTQRMRNRRFRRQTV